MHHRLLRLVAVALLGWIATQMIAFAERMFIG